MADFFDDSVSNSRRQLEPLTYTFRTALETHTSTSAYLVTTIDDFQRQPDMETFHHNNNLWEAAITQKRLRHGLRIRLESFFLFEWFPRSPGLFWTPKAKFAREDATRRIHKAEHGMVV